MEGMKLSKGEKIFNVVNIVFLGLVALSCILPVIHILAVSFSGNAAVAAGEVLLIPKDFTTTAYEYLLDKAQFWGSFKISVIRVIVGTAINMVLVILLAYPLAKTKEEFKSRNIYFWFLFFTALFNGGIIPTYMLVNTLGLMDTVWALVLPTAVNMFNVVIMINFFRGLPKELIEAAEVDGCGHFRTLWSIILPCAKPVIATIALFCIVGHWNAWFDGLMYANRTENYPLQSYLQTIIVNMDFSQGGVANPDQLKELSNQTLKTAQIIIAMIPITIVYPFLQKYFTTGLTLGSVKG